MSFGLSGFFLGLGFRARVQGLGFRVWGSGFRAKAQRVRRGEKGRNQRKTHADTEQEHLNKGFIGFRVETN